MTLEAVLDRMYAAEINAQINCFWDAGWEVWLGDHMNGWLEKANVDTAAEIAPTLYAMIVKHYPDAMLNPIICPNCKADHTERGQLAHEITCHCGHEFLVKDVIEPDVTDVPQESFQDAVRNDPAMTPGRKAKWLGSEFFGDDR